MTQENNPLGTIEIIGVVEHNDGSATYMVNMSPDMVIALAKIGLQHAVIEAAERVLDGTIPQEDAGGGDHDGGEREGV